MAGGGLVQLAVYGSQDLFLTGTPQITFFKIVYRRYTNFSIEPICQEFFGTTNFANEMTSIIDKIGDLMHKVYLEIELPCVDLVKNPSNNIVTPQDAKIQFEQIQAYYNLVSVYITTNRDVAKKLIILCRTSNIPISDIELTMNNPVFIGPLELARKQLQDFIAVSPIFDAILELRDFKFDLIQEINQIDIQKLFNYIVYVTNRSHPCGCHLNPCECQLVKNQLIRQETIQLIACQLYPAMKDFYMKAYDIFIRKQYVYQAYLNGTYVERYKFGWVEEIGHAIIDTLEVRIGNQVIDRHTGDWMILFNQIFLNEYQRCNYNKMIGNVCELTEFSAKPTPRYKLLIPLQFWFCRHSGLALPLTALRYHDVQFTLRIKDLSKLFFTEIDTCLGDIQQVQAQYCINLCNVHLYVDYVYLDSDERRRFAQSTHEYLIEVVQYHEITDINSKNYNAHLTFANPTKFLIWYVQPNQYRFNPIGTNRCQWNNFGLRPDKGGYPICNTYIRLNSYERTDTDQNVRFFNNVQPWLYFRNTPTDGFNVYSFAVEPMELQPSSTCNFSRIDDLGIVMTFTDDFMRLVECENVDGVYPGIFFVTYAYSYNILRIMSGMGGLAFQIST